MPQNKDTLRKKWWIHFDNLTKWIEETGSLPLPRSKNVKERTLYGWFICQRAAYRNGKLSEDQVEALKSAGAFNSHLDNKWHEIFRSIENYFKKHKRFPPQKSDDSNIRKLAHWRYSNIEKMKRGELSEERSHLLQNSVLTQEYSDIHWDATLEKYIEFVAKYDRTPSVNGKTKTEISLSKWRGHHLSRLKKGLLSEDKEKKFKAHDLHLNIKDIIWHSKLKRLHQFVKINRRLPFSGSENEEERLLDQWLIYNRQRMKRGKLSDSRISLLNAAGINNESLKIDKWFNNYNRLLKFIEKYERFPVYRRQSSEEHLLFEWFKSQQSKMNNGTLSKERSDYVKKLYRWYKPQKQRQDEKWHQRLRECDDFIRKYGRLPSYSQENDREKILRRWLSNQKYCIKIGKLQGKKKKLIMQLLEPFT